MEGTCARAPSACPTSPTRTPTRTPSSGCPPRRRTPPCSGPSSSSMRTRRCALSAPGPTGPAARVNHAAECRFHARRRCCWRKCAPSSRRCARGGPCPAARVRAAKRPQSPPVGSRPRHCRRPRSPRCAGAAGCWQGAGWVARQPRLCAVMSRPAAAADASAHTRQGRVPAAWLHVPHGVRARQGPQQPPVQAQAAEQRPAAAGGKRTLKMRERFHARRQDLYECFTDARKLQAFTRGPAVVCSGLGPTRAACPRLSLQQTSSSARCCLLPEVQ